MYSLPGVVTVLRMSPVSKGRKPKKSARSAGRRARSQPVVQAESAFASLQRLLGSKERPGWFDDSIRRTIDGAPVLVDAAGPRELEQLTAELVGTQLYRAIHDAGKGLWFDRWLAELADACRRRLEESVGGDDWRPFFWLLHGIAAIAPPALVPALPSRGFVKSLPADSEPPRWLSDATRIAATGEIWRMRDRYGTRYAVIAGFRYPRGNGEYVLQLDIDTSGFVTLEGVQVVDDVAQAEASWRDAVGDSAAQAQPEPVTAADQLLCLVHLDPADEACIRGDESRSVIDNWFRADRLIRELREVMRKRRMPLPAAANLYRDIDITVMTHPFAEWRAAAGVVEPNSEAVDALAAEWMEGTTPETWFSVSPRRVEFQLGLIGDWVVDEITTEALALMPTWVRWLGERADLPADLQERVITAASTPVALSGVHDR